MELLVGVVVVLALAVLVLLARVRGLDERLARLEGRREPSAPYRSAPPQTEEVHVPGREGDDPEILAALRSGNKIAAIKRYRELTGESLKDAKDAVEAMEARYPGPPRL